jgi:uncharacterized protein DUF4367
MYTSEAELGRALSALAPLVDWPAEPALASRVTTRIEAGPSPVRASLFGRLRPRLSQPAFLAAATAVLAALVVLVASPAARDAVADFIGFDDVRIEFTGRLPSDIGARLHLGEAVTLQEAESRADFDVRVPTSDDLADPDRVFFDPIIGNGQVSLIYAPRDGLPATPNDRVGLLVLQFRGSIEGDYYKKLVADNFVEEVVVVADPGFWVEGPHILQYRDENGTIGSAAQRLVGHTLLWQHGGVTYRIESALSKDEAIEIAESLR